MANRTDVNADFTWYNDDDRVAILYRNQSSGKYASWDGSDIEDGIRLHYTAKYEAAKYYDNNLKDDNRVDSGLHTALLDYVKHRIEEDIGNVDKSTYFYGKYRNKVRTYPHRRSGQRGIKVPNL